MEKDDIELIRRFNRFYTGILGLLDRHILSSQYSLPEARVLYELFQHQPCRSATLLEYMDIDKGYLSRILRSFERRGIVKRKKSTADGRASLLNLTKKGNKDFAVLDSASRNQLSQLLAHLTPGEVRRLTRHMSSIQRFISKGIRHEKATA